MRKVGSGSGEGLRKAGSRVVLNIPETIFSSDQTSRRPGSGQQPPAKSFAQKYDTLLVFLGVVVFLSVVGLFFVHSFYLNSIKVGDVILPGHTPGRELARPNLAVAGQPGL